MIGRWRGAGEVLATGVLAAGVSVAVGVSGANLAVLAAVAGAGVALAFGGRGDAVPLAAVFPAAFALSEAVEGRGGEVGRGQLALGLAAMATILWALVTRRRGAGWPLLGAGLLVLLGLFSAGSGSAGTMRPWFSGWLSPGVAEGTVVVLRKAVHSTFYPLLAYTAWRSFGSPDLRRGLLGAFLFAAVFAVFDEVRQAGIPGRGGAARDVALDLAATALVLGFLWRRGSRSSSPTGS